MHEFCEADLVKTFVLTTGFLFLLWIGTRP
jgi:hypothetical protein